MSAATTTAIVASLIAAGASTGAELYVANKQANAAKGAANTQALAGQQALQLQRQMYQQQQQNLSPYMNVGQSVLPQLGQMATARPPAFASNGGAPPSPFAPPNFAPPNFGPKSPWDTPWNGGPK